MIDQLIIGDKASFDDFGASVASRKINAPEKKSIKETVPFSNVTYDFSAINGEVYWEEREIEYVFEIIAPTPERLEQKKIAFSNWVMNVISQNIFDPFITEYHFNGTFAKIDYADEDDIEKSTITVTFTTYPYKIANLPKAYNIIVPASGETTVIIVNDASHRITPTITTDAAIVLKLDNTSYSVPAGEIKSDNFKLAAGVNTLTVQNTADTDCAVAVSFYEEVL